MRSMLLVVCLVLAGCSHILPLETVRPGFPPLPDTIYTASGATPVVLVDSIKSPVSNRSIIGQYRYADRVLLVSRVVKDNRQQRKVLEHERCHIVLFETGLALHIDENLAELLCDAFANARVQELERQR